MSHLDEGTLHALLDGELELAEVREIQLHLGTCAACGSRLQDVKQFLAEADRLVGALELPAGGHAREEPRRQPPAPPPPPPLPPQYREPDSWETPVLLLPDPGEALERRKRWGRRLRWAAMIAVVVGAGRVLTSSLRSNEPTVQLSERAPTFARPQAVISPEETGRPDTASVAPPAARPAPAPRQPSPKARQEPKVLVDEPAPVVGGEADTATPASEDSAPTDQVVLAEGESAEARPADRTRQDPELETRRAAAAALAELDRERLRSRASAATAALPPARIESVQTAVAPPPPRTLEQRAQVYLRIGLDEAARQLGRPMHVIEIMTPEFIGLTQGRAVPGADASRPVVRVVYQDSRGRMILLDQQRMRTGQGPGAPAGSLRWSLGDVMLYLHGEAPSDVLRNLQRRVR